MSADRRNPWSERGRAAGLRPLVVAAVITPFRGAELDPSSFEENIRYHDASGLDGILVGGTTGENAILRAEERDREIAIAKDVLADEMIIFGGVMRRTRDSDDALRDVDRMAKAGAHAALVAPPDSMTSETDADRLVQFMTSVCAGAALPVFFYHPPQMSERPLSAATIRRIAAVPGLAGVKDSTPHEDLVRLWSEAAPASLATFVGNPRLFRKLAGETTGGMLAIAGLLPAEWIEWATTFAARRSTAAIEESMRPFEERLRAGGLVALKEMYEEASLFGGDPTPAR